MQWPTDRATLIIYMEALRKALKQWKADERAGGGGAGRGVRWGALDFGR